MKRLNLTILAWLFVLSFTAIHAEDDNVALEEDSPDPKLAKIVLVAGIQSGNIQHQYWAGTVAIAKLLRQTPGVHVSIVRGGWPKNPAIFDNARAIVLYMEGGEGGTIHPLSEPGRLEILQKAIDKGAGLASFHKGSFIPDELGRKMLDLQGAYYDFKASNKGHWTVSFSTFVDHPATRGMKPFTLNDGYCVGINFAEGMKGVTPLLYAPKSAGDPKATTAAESSSAARDITAWAFEKPDGKRAFCFTGLHSHRYLTEESIRKLVVNGILWAAKIDVPAGGAKVDLDPAELEKNVEPLSKPPAKK